MSFYDRFYLYFWLFEAACAVFVAWQIMVKKQRKKREKYSHPKQDARLFWGSVVIGFTGCVFWFFCLNIK